MKKDTKKKRDYTYYDLTQSMCRECRKIIDAQIIFRNDRVYIRSICPEHGTSEALIASKVDWYLKAINFRQAVDKPMQFSRKTSKGCPHDCGLCEWHEKACNIPILSITNACNLNCPFCFTPNRDGPKHFMSVEEFRRTIDWLVDLEQQIDLINIIGGDPSLHPELFTFIKICKRKEIGRVGIYSNGLKIAEDEDFVEKLAYLDVYVTLSFNTFDRNVSKEIHGIDLIDYKLKALANLEKHNVKTGILAIPVKSLNDKEISVIINLALKKDFIRSITIQSMPSSYSEKCKFTSKTYLTIDEIINEIVKKSRKRLIPDDFSPLPGSHPLCYSTCYVIQDGDYVFPLKRLFHNDGYYKLLGKKYLLQPDEYFKRIFEGKINEILSEKKSCFHSNKNLSIIKKILSMLYPEGRHLSLFERQKIMEKFIKYIYIHAPMDEDTFDVSRVIRCGDLVSIKNKNLIPACSYGLLYRKKDMRFHR